MDAKIRHPGRVAHRVPQSRYVRNRLRRVVAGEEEAEQRHGERIRRRDGIGVVPAALLGA
jgi:hypothetical protein